MTQSESITKDIKEIDQKVKTLQEEIESQNQKIWITKALVKSHLKHKTALEESLKALISLNDLETK